jgi:hypothetical protein
MVYDEDMVIAYGRLEYYAGVLSSHSETRILLYAITVAATYIDVVF